MEITLLIVAVIVAIGAFNVYTTKKRRENLFTKYGDMQVVDAIMARKIWQSMSKEQLIDSWGSPVDIGQKVLRSKTVETYKYSRTGKNRYASRVTLENSRVIGWEQK